MDGTPLEMAQACAQGAIDARREWEASTAADSANFFRVSEMKLDQVARWSLLSIAESLAQIAERGVETFTTYDAAVRER